MVTRRKSDPYGNPRGVQPSGWPGDRTFFGTGVEDSSTGLDITDPLRMNGHSYANGNPVGDWDPTGLVLEECASGMYVCGNRGVKRDELESSRRVPDP